MGALRKLQPAVPKQLEKAVQAGQKRRAEQVRKRPRDGMPTVLNDAVDKLGG